MSHEAVCPLRDMDFAGNDIGMIDEVESWEKCGKSSNIKSARS